MSLPAAASPEPSRPLAEPGGEHAPTGTEQGAPVDQEAFRRVVGNFVTGITVVTTRWAGIDHAMTASAFTSVSLDPLLVLVCVDKDARFRDAVVDAGFWGVSVLSVGGRRAAEWFATKGRPLVGQLDRFPHHRGRTLDVALLDDAIAWLEVRNTAVYDAGDHDIVLGQVVDLAVGDRDAVPLLYHRGHYSRLG